MATKTSTELAVRVLQNLNFIRPGFDPDQEQVATVLDRWAGVHAAMVDDGEAYWPRDAIPLPAFETVGWYLAVEVAPAFGALPVVLQAIGAPNAEAAKAPLLVKLRRHVAADYFDEPLRIIPF